jgi:hypothetical protein
MRPVRTLPVCSVCTLTVHVLPSCCAGAQGAPGEPSLCKYGWTVVVAVDRAANDQSSRCRDVVTGNQDRCATAQVGSQISHVLSALGCEAAHQT